MAEDFIARMRYAPNTQVRSLPSPQRPPPSGSSLASCLSDWTRRAGKPGAQSEAVRPPSQTHPVGKPFSILPSFTIHGIF